MFITKTQNHGSHFGYIWVYMMIQVHYIVGSYSRMQHPHPQASNMITVATYYDIHLLVNEFSKVNMTFLHASTNAIYLSYFAYMWWLKVQIHALAVGIMIGWMRSATTSRTPD